MNFSKTSSYALMVLNEMASKPESNYTAVFLNKKLNIPYQYLRQLLTSLAKHDLIQSHKGRYGGFSLARSSDEIYIAEIIEAVEGLNILGACIVGFETCPFDKPCALHETWEEIRESIFKVLKTTSLSHFVEEHSI